MGFYVEHEYARDCARIFLGIGTGEDDRGALGRPAWIGLAQVARQYLYEAAARRENRINPFRLAVLGAIENYIVSIRRPARLMHRERLECQLLLLIAVYPASPESAIRVADISDPLSVS